MPDACFNVNGRDVHVDVPPDTPLLLVLRNDLGLRGTRHGCGEGDCGACTVLVNGQAMTACNLPVESVEGARVETVESLTTGEMPHPLVQAVIQEQAGQCGYCLAGILMRATALLASNAAPSRQEVAAALDSNLCRCGSHDRILRAVQRAAAQGPVS